MYEFIPEVRAAYEKLSLPMAIYQYEDKKVITLLVSDGLCHAKGLEREELTSTFTNSMFEMVHPDDAGRLSKIGKYFAEHLCGYDVLYRAIQKDKKYHLLHTIGKWQTMEDGTELAFLYYIDVTESGRSLNEIYDAYIKDQKDNFYIDVVTKIPNMNYFEALANEKIYSIKKQNKTPVLIFFDINGMQAYNSEYGFAKGNELLSLTANEIRNTFNDDLVTRAFNDHFLVITGSDDFEAKIKKINLVVKNHTLGNATGIRAGITYLDENTSLTDSIGNAKRCTKEIGNNLNTVYKFFSKEIDEAYWNQRYIVGSFDKALSEKWIKVFYQPIIRVKSGKVSSCEGLARWDDPKMGLVSPAKFIPVLEKYHLLYKLDLYMVDEICAEVEKRKNAGLAIIPTSVNFSGQDFDNIDIAAKLESILKKYNLPPDVLIIEITEQAVATATENFTEQFRRIKELGFKIWIDDFGSGYSSLNVFAQYDFNLVKFDMEFMRHLDDHNGANRHIMKAIIDVAKKMHINTLAEGIETKEHLDFLDEIGCDRAQGYYFSKPVPLDILLMNRLFMDTTPVAETKEESEIADTIQE